VILEPEISMLRSVATLLASSAVALALCTTTARAEALPFPTRPLVVAVTPNYAVRAERHPEIRRAIDDLERARYAMQHAAHDFGGHRVDAMRACDNAIAQLRLALQFDR
jgi:hypothetical protein